MKRAFKLLFLAVLYACCAHYTLPKPDGSLPAGGLQRLYRAAPGVYHSEQPSKQDFLVLRDRYKIASVIKLNVEWLPFDGGHDDVPDGVTVRLHPWPPAGPVDHDDVQATLDDVDSLPRPLLWHCTHGQDRTMLLWGLWSVSHGMNPETAWRIMVTYGFHDGVYNTPGLPGLVETFTRETGYHP